MMWRTAKPSIAACDQVLQQLIWNAAMNPDDSIRTFKLDCYLFEFGDNFTKKIEYDFFQFAKTLDLSDLRAVLKLWIWLRQQHVDFKFRFQWTRSLPILHNILTWDKVCAMKRLLAALSEEAVMSYDLAACQYALHP